VTPAPRVDSHVHAFPDRLAMAVREALNREGRLQGSPLLGDVANSVREQGFDAAWVLPYAHKAGVAASVNEWSAAEVSNYPWLVAGATFHPDDPDLEGIVEDALVRLRLRVVKLHCSVGDFDAADARLAPLWRIAGNIGVPVVVHAGRGPGMTDARDLDSVITVLKRHQDLRFVLAHSGHPACERAIELMRDFPNLYGDLTPVWDSPVAVPTHALAEFQGRFLFGSDAPNNPVTAGDQARGYESMGLGADAVSALMGGAAAALIPLM
jgi:predicted TIM-barrel fold metal-dependent hydrolase